MTRGVATPMLATMAKTTEAVMVDAVLPLEPEAMAVAPETTSRRFLGLTSARIADSPAALAGGSPATADIHLGAGGSTSALGRPRQLRRDRNSRPAPRRILTIDTQTGCASTAAVEVPARNATTPVSSPIARNQVMTKARALAKAPVPSSINTTATIGSGLTITPPAMGRDWPVAGPTPSSTDTGCTSPLAHLPGHRRHRDRVTAGSRRDA